MLLMPQDEQMPDAIEHDTQALHPSASEQQTDGHQTAAAAATAAEQSQTTDWSVPGECALCGADDTSEALGWVVRSTFLRQHVIAYADCFSHASCH